MANYSLLSHHKMQQHGFGLIEIMIALALGLAILLGMSTIFVNSSRSLSEVESVGELLENAFYTLETLASDVELAGYWGEAGYPLSASGDIFVAGEVPSDPPSAAFPQPPFACVGTGDSAFSAKEELSYAAEFPLFSESGADLNGDLVSCTGQALTAKAASEFLSVRRASTCEAGQGRCRDYLNNFHIQTNGCAAGGLAGGEVKLYQVTSANVGSTMTHLDGSCVAGNLAPVYRYISRIYYVSQDNRLVRLFLDYSESKLQYRLQEISSGVEYLAFEWGIDGNADGQIDTNADGSIKFIREPASADWANVISVRIWLVVHREGNFPSDTNSYTIAGEEYLVPASLRNYKRIVKSTTVDVINISGPRR